MERTFSIRNCIAREKIISEVSPSFLPTLEIEGEIGMVSNYMGNIKDEDHLLGQKMMEMSLKRFCLSLSCT